MSSSQEETTFSLAGDDRSPSSNNALGPTTAKFTRFLSADIPLSDIPEKEPESEKTEGD